MPISTRRLIRIAHGLPILTRDGKINVERFLRGRKEAKRLSRADYAVVSFPKSGRTWLRVILSRYFRNHYALPDAELLYGVSLQRLDPRVPAVVFTHQHFIDTYLGRQGMEKAFSRKPVVLLVRHPADTAVSMYFQRRHRMTSHDLELRGLPHENTEQPLIDFLMQPGGGLDSVISFLNRWADHVRHHPRLIMVRYEDMRANAEAELHRILTFMGQAPSADALRDAIDYADFTRMKKLEESNTYAGKGNILAASPEVDQNARKVRRGKVGGYREDFTESEVEEIDKRIAASLDPVFGY